jgi:hypothetical protein
MARQLTNHTAGRERGADGTEKAIRDSLASGTGMVKVAGTIRSGVSAVARISREMAAG